MTPVPSSSLVSTQNYSEKDHSLIPAHLSGTICLGQSITLILLLQSKPLLKPTFSKTFSNLSVFSTAIYASVVREWCVGGSVGGCVRGCVSVAIVKRPVLALNFEDGRCINLIFFFFFFLQHMIVTLDVAKVTMNTYNLSQYIVSLNVNNITDKKLCNQCRTTRIILPYCAVAFPVVLQYTY